ncbi:hypothetical protein Goe19_01520 [Bacillus phage vB_BsuM-Goe19]|nr:hypothetical protein Goe19_01520 [Bacillus phage vB_BsuM-Goe19]
MKRKLLGLKNGIVVATKVSILWSAAIALIVILIHDLGSKYCTTYSEEFLQNICVRDVDSYIGMTWSFLGITVLAIYAIIILLELMF